MMWGERGGQCWHTDEHGREISRLLVACHIAVLFFTVDSLHGCSLKDTHIGCKHTTRESWGQKNRTWVIGLKIGDPLSLGLYKRYMP